MNRLSPTVLKSLISIRKNLIRSGAVEEKWLKKKHTATLLVLSAINQQGHSVTPNLIKHSILMIEHLFNNFERLETLGFNIENHVTSPKFVEDLLHIIQQTESLIKETEVKESE